MILVYLVSVYAQNKTIRLLPPRLDNGKTLMQALKERGSGREFSSKELPLEVLSDMLCGERSISLPWLKR